jgi:hypothetical protein
MLTPIYTLDLFVHRLSLLIPLGFSRARDHSRSTLPAAPPGDSPRHLLKPLPLVRWLIPEDVWHLSDVEHLELYRKAYEP